MGLSLRQILVDGLILSVGASLILLGTMALNPRLMLKNYPPQIRAKLAPLTNTEKRQLLVMGLLFYGFAIGVIFYSTRALIARNGAENLFLLAFLNTYLVFGIFNIFDLLVLDYLLLMVVKPGFLFIPGTEGMAQYNTFSFHFAGFLKGLIGGAVISLMVTIVTVVTVRVA